VAAASPDGLDGVPTLAQCGFALQPDQRVLFEGGETAALARLAVKVEERGALETADRALMLARQVWEYWLPTAGVEQRNITEGLKARLTPYRSKSFAAIVEPKRFGDLMRAIQSYKGGPIVRTALQLAPLLYQRPANLRMMEWAELDLDAALWTIPSMKMKRTKEEKENGEDHAVPLPVQAVALLRNLQPLTAHGVYVFPGERSHDMPISDNSVRSALYALGFGKEQTWHGFRASARTMLVDELNLDISQKNLLCKPQYWFNKPNLEIHCERRYF
jgi:integrase